MKQFKIGQRVIVSALLTGTGERPHGTVTDVYEFARETFVEVHYDAPTIDGRLGCTVTNLGLIEKEAA
jgi:hypothetical protein